MKQNLLSLSVLWVAINIKHRHLVGLFLRWWLLLYQLFMFSTIHFVSKNMIYFLCFPFYFFPPHNEMETSFIFSEIFICILWKVGPATTTISGTIPPNACVSKWVKPREHLKIIDFVSFFNYVLRVGGFGLKLRIFPLKNMIFLKV